MGRKKSISLHETELKELDNLSPEQINERIAQVAKNQEALEETLDLDPGIADIRSRQASLRNELNTAMQSYNDGTSANKLRIKHLRSRLKNMNKPAGDFIGGRPMISDEGAKEAATKNKTGKKAAGGDKEQPFNDGLQKAVGKFVEGVQSRLLPGESVTFKGPDGTGPTINAKSQ